MIAADPRPGADPIIAGSMTLIGLILVTGICTAIYLGMTKEQQEFARDLSMAVGAVVVLIVGFILIAFGVTGLVNL